MSKHRSSAQPAHRLTRRSFLAAPLLGGLGAGFVGLGDTLAWAAGTATGAASVNALGAALDANGGLIRANGARMVHTDLQLAVVAAKVAAGDPAATAAWASLINESYSRSTWVARPLAVVIRGVTGQNFGQLAKDVQAAYANALRWRIGGDSAHGDCARDILNAWSALLTRIDGNSNALLAAGIYGTTFANAAELMRGYPGFDFDRFSTRLTTAFYPLCASFLKDHFGTIDHHYWPNWDLVAVASILSIGIVTRDPGKVNEACNYMLDGKGLGSIPNAIPFILKDGTGVWLEACRDQGHTRLGLNFMGAICEMAWNQGVDLYGAYDHRFQRGAEYIARWNLGYNVEFPAWTYRSGQVAHVDHIQSTTFTAASAAYRGLGGTFALVKNHYTGRLGRPCPNISEMMGKSGIEGNPGEGVGYGSLTAMPAAVDLARGKTATQSSTYQTCVAANALDGNTDASRASIAHTLHQTQPWWQVDLGSVAQLSAITLWNRTDSFSFRWNNAVVMISATDPTGRSFDQLQADSSVVKRSIGVPTTPAVTLDVTGISGRYVRVQLPGSEYLNLAEVQVLGWPVAPAAVLPAPVQLATRKFAHQSSTWDGNKGAFASRAVDGNTDGNYHRGSVSHTASAADPHGSEANAWWQVDLGGVFALEKVTLFNRTDCCSDRWNGALVFVSQTDPNGRGFYDLQKDTRVAVRGVGTASGTSLMLSFLGVKGRYIRVQLPGTGNLQLAEVQVTGFPSLS